MTIVKQTEYRGYTITTRSYQSPRFGTIYKSTSDYGEPYLTVLGFTDMGVSIEIEKKNLDQCLDQ